MPPGRETNQVVIGPKKFKTFKDAEAYLRKNPKYLIQNIGYIKKVYPAIIKGSGYRLVQTPSPHGPRWTLKQNGSAVWYHKPNTDLPWSVDPNTLKSGLVNNPTITTTAPGIIPKDNAAAIAAARGNTGAGVTTSGSDMDAQTLLGALSSIPGLDASMLAKIKLPDGTPLPLALAKRGANTMNPMALDQLVSSITQGGSKRVESLFAKERAQVAGQNAQNVKDIRSWYDQVLASQGVAAQRDREFGQAAVQSQTDSGAAIISALGGEANEGAGMVGAAAEASVGNINAIGTIQDQYNSDIAPILKAEAAGAMARETAMGSSRMRDLSMRLEEARTASSADEAKLRYEVWQANNQILDNRLQREIGIRQYNAGLPQQKFQNQMGMWSAVQAAQLANIQGATNKVGTAIQLSENARKAALDQAKLVASQRGQWKPFAQSPSTVRKAASEAISGGLVNSGTSYKDALKYAAQVVNTFGWQINNPAVMGFVRQALTKAGYKEAGYAEGDPKL